MTHPSQHRFLVLDGIRGIAALCVMFYHFNQSNLVLDLAGKPLFATADLAVDLFFVLSGFVLCHSYAGPLGGKLSARDYVLRRLIRLYPLFLAGLAIGVAANLILLGTPCQSLDMAGIVGSALVNLLYLPFPNAASFHSFCGQAITQGAAYPLNGPAWSLFFEMIASLAFLWLHKLPVRQLLLLCAAAFAAFLALGVLEMTLAGKAGFAVGLGWSMDNFLGGFPRVLFGFTLGLVLYKAAQQRSRIAALLPASIGGIGLYVMVFAALLVPSPARGLYSIAFLLLIAPLLVAAGAQAQPGDGWKQQLSIGLGWISYPVYCLHFPIGTIVYFYGKQAGIGNGALFLLASLVTLAASLVVGRLFDEPVRRWLSGLTRKAAP